MNKKETFKSFIDKHEVLVVDKNPTSRSRLIKIMCDLGSKRHAIHAVGSFHEAADIIHAKNIGVVLSDFYIVGGSGFDLFKLVKEKNPTKKICTILVTSDLTQSTVAKAAEEDVDSYIVKPFTVESIQENLINTIADKVSPSDYVKIIEEGKKLLEADRYDEAIEKLNSSLPLHPKPSLALFYIGQAEYLKEQIENAKGTYNKGLELNHIHFKCLTGLYDLLMKRNNFYEAYEVVKKVAKYFPANPERLQQVVRLAVQTQNYQDMQSYYEIFTSMDERTNEMINYIGAGMFVSGKHYMKIESKEDALKLFDNIGVSCSQFPKYPSAIIAILIEYQLPDEAEKFLKRFDTEARNTDDYLVCNFLIDALKFKDHNRIVKNGLDLYNRNIKDFRCMKIMVQAMKDSGYKQDRIEDFMIEISKLWPERLTG